MQDTKTRLATKRSTAKSSQNDLKEDGKSAMYFEQGQKWEGVYDIFRHDKCNSLTYRNIYLMFQPNKRCLPNKTTKTKKNKNGKARKTKKKK